MTKILDYNKICEDVKALDSKIRFAGVVNPRGKLVAGGMKEGIEPLESPKDDEMLFMELALRVRMRQEFDRQLGKVKFSLSVRERALAMSFPAGTEDILYVYSEADADFCQIPQKIIKLIESD